MANKYGLNIVKCLKDLRIIFMDLMAGIEPQRLYTIRLRSQEIIHL